jgi:hypothetical protein
MRHPIRHLLLAILFVILSNSGSLAQSVHHYVFFDRERERISEESFLSTQAFEGAQLKYTWRELEPQKDNYDFSAIRKDLAFLTSKGKKLFIQLQDVTFSAQRVFVPEYLRTPEYNDGVAPQALKRAFPKSVVMQYANFMPGEWLPGEDKSYLRSVYKAAQEIGVGVGGPDLLPFKRPQLNHAYPLIKDSSGKVPTGIAVQEGNYAEANPATGQRPTIAELLQFATNNLKVNYVFWCTEEPYYSKEVIPFFSHKKAQEAQK